MYDICDIARTLLAAGRKVFGYTCRKQKLLRHTVYLQNAGTGFVHFFDGINRCWGGDASRLVSVVAPVHH